MNKKIISIICPVYNDAGSIIIFYDRFKKTVSTYEDSIDFQLIFTNNASSDNSLNVMESICKKDNYTNVLTLSRNFGYQKSMLAGLNYAKGDACICIDVDCEDPPEIIPKFIDNWLNGYSLVYGERIKRDEPVLIQWCRKIFYNILNKVSDYDNVPYMAEFCLFSKEIKDIIISNNSTFPFIRNELAFAGFRRKKIQYNRERRSVGESHYNIFSMAKFAVAGILTASTWPLRLIMYVSIPLIFINIISIFLYMFNGFNIMSIIAMDMIFFIMALSFISIYVARIYQDIVSRPKYIINWNESIINNLK